MASAKSEDESVRVMVRFRPVRDLESNAETSKTFDVKYDENDESYVALSQHDKNTLQTIERAYHFDRVFPPTASQPQVFKDLAMIVVDEVLEGYNGTIFAYGQTGSGKTFSMFGPGEEVSAKRFLGKDRGIIPRSVERLFEMLEINDKVERVNIKCSLLEIYKEQLRDLLNIDGPALSMRETTAGVVRVLGLREVFCGSPQDIVRLIMQGEKHRSVSATDMNELSSRSHTVLTIQVIQKLTDSTMRSGKLSFADLAGSERASKSGLTGDTLDEAKKINQSLSALGNCINALTDAKRSHVPFRDSKLTYFLKDSLSGNTKTTLLVTCSPHAANSDETLSSLKFGERAAHVTNSVQVNKQLSMQELEQLVTQLKRQLKQNRMKIKQMSLPTKGSSPKSPQNGRRKKERSGSQSNLASG